MKDFVQIHINIDTDRIMRSRGLDSDRANTFLASTVQQMAEPYVPMSSTASAHMKNRANIKDDKKHLIDRTTITSDGKQIVYPEPYSHYLWRGEVMAGRAPKRYTGEPLQFHDAPWRGKEWINRMMADRGGDVERAVKTYIKNGGKG